MSSLHLVSGSDKASPQNRPGPASAEGASHSPAPLVLAAAHGSAAARTVRPLSALPVNARGTVHHLCADQPDRVDRLLALGVTPGAPVTVLQTFPGVVFLCDQTELAVERDVAEVIFIMPAEG